MGRAGGNNGGTEMELDKLGVGSIVENAMGVLFTKDAHGDWRELSISLGSSPVRKLDYLKAGTVIRDVRRGPLDDFVKGDIISFESSYGVRVATKLRDDFWQITGSAGECTTDELDTLVLDEDSVRKVGSLDGGS